MGLEFSLWLEAMDRCFKRCWRIVVVEASPFSFDGFKSSKTISPMIPSFFSLLR